MKSVEQQLKEGYEQQSALIEQHNVRNETLQEQLYRNKRLLGE